MGKANAYLSALSCSPNELIVLQWYYSYSKRLK
jgi:hypothetical protein